MAQILQDDIDSTSPTHERVYRTLRGEILHGAMSPGEALTLRGIAERLSVSMTPAREAVRRLVAERALEMTASGRVIVPRPDAARLDELFQARLLLEPELARRAGERALPSLRAELAGIDAKIDDDLISGDAAAYIHHNTRFHERLYRAAEAPALLALVESVWLQTAPMMRRVYGRLGTREMTDYHEAALAALAARDSDALAAAIHADVAQGRDLMRQAGA
ncbi:GntR family transcriptional regulator [Rhodobacteraceae bacterium NNCM2]|nr:GntR family transcriptional regulator [Coraliihabitans acroporae]